MSAPENQAPEGADEDRYNPWPFGWARWRPQPGGGADVVVGERRPEGDGWFSVHGRFGSENAPAAPSPAEGDAADLQKLRADIAEFRSKWNIWPAFREDKVLQACDALVDEVEILRAAAPNVQPKGTPAGYVTAFEEGKVLMLPRPSLDTAGLVAVYTGAQAPAPAHQGCNYIVSIVMTAHRGNNVNTQNKLYGVEAVSPDEAHGKAIALAQADFPEHQFHTACHWALEAPAVQAEKEQP